MQLPLAILSGDFFNLLTTNVKIQGFLFLYCVSKVLRHLDKASFIEVSIFLPICMWVLKFSIFINHKFPFKFFKVSHKSMRNTWLDIFPFLLTFIINVIGSNICTKYIFVFDILRALLSNNSASKYLFSLEDIHLKNVFFEINLFC